MIRYQIPLSAKPTSSGRKITLRESGGKTECNSARKQALDGIPFLSKWRYVALLFMVCLSFRNAPMPRSCCNNVTSVLEWTQEKYEKAPTDSLKPWTNIPLRDDNDEKRYDVNNDDDPFRNITHVYHIGRGGRYGRDNNQLITIFHAVDIALDNHGDPPNHRAIVAVSRWAFGVLKKMFYDGNNETEFAVFLETKPSKFPLIVKSDRVDSLFRHNVTSVYLNAHFTYFYTRNHKDRVGLTPDLIRKRRRWILGQFFHDFGGIPKRNLVLHDMIQKYLRDVYYNNKATNEGTTNNNNHYDDNSKNNNKNDKYDRLFGYVTVHARWMEGSCEDRVGDSLHRMKECWMSPQYIKNVLQTAEIPPTKPIVLIGDGQNKQVEENLRGDPDIGPRLIVPSIDFSSEYTTKIELWTQPLNDMMAAILPSSEAFVGTRVSTFATVIGVSREVAFDAPPKTNFIYTDYPANNATNGDSAQVMTNSKTANGVQSTSLSSSSSLGQKSPQLKAQSLTVKICEDCLFLCDPKKSHFCGHEFVHT